MKGISYVGLCLFSFLMLDISQSVAYGREDMVDISQLDWTTYKAEKEITLEGLANIEDTFEQRVQMTLPAGTTLLILDNRRDAVGRVWLRVGVESVIDLGLESQDIWILETELQSLPLHLFNDAILRMTYCYRYVKLYLLNNGLVDSYLPGASAYMAATILPKYGFSKVSRKPSAAIYQDVCVYKGGPSGHGHIEVKTNQGWYYGYGYKKAPIKNRIFIACFHK